MDFLFDIRCAFKKLKSSVCFDKTQVVFRDKLVRYEGYNVDDNFIKLNELITGDQEIWDLQVQEWLKTIEVLVYPKTVVNKNAIEGLTFNRVEKSFEVDKLQHMFNSCVEIQLLGILWIMIFGKELDKKNSEHAYGNRLKKRLHEPDEMSKLSPHLFHPYFELYESWRDEGLKIAEKFIDNGKDVVVFTMDLKRYYYNARLSESNFEKIEKEYLKKSKDLDLEIVVIKRLNKLVFNVMKRYTDKLVQLTDELEKVGNDACLPIGYFPSAILSNWYLQKFDEAIVSKWNPLYYGRYVDDFLIVDKVEKDSVLHNKADDDELTREFIMDFFMCNCQTENFPKCENEKVLMNKKETHKLNHECKKTSNGHREECIGCNTETNYFINTAHLPTNKQLLCVQNSKVKSYYFHSNGNKQLLQSFRKELNENRSEWRFLPEEEEALFEHSYDNIYEIQRERGATVNKFREIDNVTLHKYSLSKYLGKLSFVKGLTRDKVCLKFEDDLLKIFDQKTIIENFVFWERLYEVLLRKRNFTKALEFTKQIIQALKDVKISSKLNNSERDICTLMQETLFCVFVSSISRPLSLIWGQDVVKFCKDLEEIFDKVLEDNFEDIGWLYYYYVEEKNRAFFNIRRSYCETRMFNKNICPVPIDFLNEDTIYTDKNSFSLSDFDNCISAIKKSNNENDVVVKLEFNKYQYHPYVVSLQEIEFAYCLSNLYNGNISNFSTVKETLKMFNDINGFPANAETSIKGDLKIDNKFHVTQVVTKYCNEDAEKESRQNLTNTDIKVAVANVKLEQKNFKDVLLEQPNRTSKRYGRLRKIVNQAIEENVDILVLPEAYLPLEWIPALTRRATKNKMAIITGVEWIIRDYKDTKEVVNLTASILPYTTEKGDTYAHIHLHHKTHYAPEEASQITGHGFTYREGARYDLFNYNHFWFSVYCCYELTAINERSLFMGYADALIAVEWNKDTNYFSNIIESLSRDVHCYCVQVNTSEYGDSRIVAPMKTELKDIVRTKGGINDTIIVGTLDVKTLRDFQLISYELQKQDKRYKTTPPAFPIEIVKKKRKNKLYNEIFKQK